MSLARTAGDRAVAVDGATVAAVSLAIAVAAERLAPMSAFVPAAIGLRFVLWARLPPAERDGTLREEVLFFVLCTALGAFNDWSSVVRHGVYDYTVPHYFAVSSIPLWMLLFWGMILRCMATVTRWRRLGAPGAPDDHVQPGRRPIRAPGWRIGVELALILITRQLVYRLHDHPWWSWAPFAVALAVYAWLLRPTRHDLRLMALVAVMGPAIEALYIQVGGLHRYALGWIAGVPLWIALWWVLAVVLWKDLSLRLHGILGRWAAPASPSRAARG